MKKNYMAPTTCVVVIAVQQMIASTTLDSTASPSVEVSSGEFGGTFSSRGGDLWDDEY